MPYDYIAYTLIMLFGTLLWYCFLGTVLSASIMDRLLDGV